MKVKDKRLFNNVKFKKNLLIAVLIKRKKIISLFIWKKNYKKIDASKSEKVTLNCKNLNIINFIIIWNLFSKSNIS